MTTTGTDSGGRGQHPLPTVEFEAAALFDRPGPGRDAAPQARPGARRLVAALAARGVGVRVAVPGGAGADSGADDLAADLAAAGISPEHVSFAGPDRERTPSDRTLVVTADDRPVHRVVLEALTDLVGAFRAAAQLTGALDRVATGEAAQHHLRLTKPPGSLGRLETVGVQLAGIASAMPPPLPRPAAVAVFAGDHGVHRQGVSPWPQEVTAQMVVNFLGGGAAINVLARQSGAEVVVVDVGVARELPDAPGLLARKVRAGTGDLAVGPAMAIDDASRALDVGAEVATTLVDGGARCLVTGDMGIANTTPSAALIAALTDRPAPAVTGRGTGIDDAMLRRKTALVAAAASRARHLHGDDALAILAEIGGLEHAALAGFVVGGAALHVPVVIDGVIAASALLVASRLVPGVERAVIAGHRSVEPGASAVLGTLGLDPMVDLGIRLGEGAGAALALPLLEAAARVLAEMATFDQVGVTGK
jgi:nicotinate-nucleotide--dimethylbenzimidazole phosphoribosyltransferase